MRGERKSNGGNEGHRERQQELGTTFQTEAAVIFASSGSLDFETENLMNYF